MLAEIEEFATGVRSTEMADRILATVLFVDMVRSTERAVELGDAAWRHLLDLYYTVARKEIARFRGREMDTAGDGFFATFDGPARAICCALAIEDSVKQLDIEVRAGVHTGGNVSRWATNWVGLRCTLPRAYSRKQARA